MTSRSNQILTMIMTRVKNPITNKKQFTNKDQIIEEALEVYLTQLKAEKLL